MKKSKIVVYMILESIKLSYILLKHLSHIYIYFKVRSNFLKNTYFPLLSLIFYYLKFFIFLGKQQLREKLKYKTREHERLQNKGNFHLFIIVIFNNMRIRVLIKMYWRKSNDLNFSRVPDCSSSDEDTCIWTLENKSSFSVRSFYKFLIDGGTQTPLYLNYWKVDWPNKITLFY